MTPPSRVGVLYGGPSAEQEISRISGRAVATALRARGHVLQELDMASDEEACRRQLAACGLDTVFIAMHGTFGEDGGVQRALEDEGIAYTGSDPAASALAMDKPAARHAFASVACRVPRAVCVGVVGGVNRRRLFRRVRQLVESRPGGRWVVKPVDQGSSVGISIVSSLNELLQAVTHAAQFGPRVLIEEWIDGRELTVGVLGDHVLPVVEVVPDRTFYDFRAKYESDKTRYHVPADLSTTMAERLQAIAWRCHTALGCRDMSRVDLMLPKHGQPVVLEVNTIPGFTPKSLLPMAAAAVGISFEHLCEHVLQRAMARAEYSSTKGQVASRDGDTGWTRLAPLVLAGTLRTSRPEASGPMGRQARRGPEAVNSRSSGTE